MRFNVTGGHAFGVHGQNLLLDVLADASLIFPQHLGVKFALAIPRHRYLYIAKTGAQGFAAVPVPAVIRVLVLVVIPAVAQLIVQLGLQTVFQELRDSVLEQFLDVSHAAYIRQLQQLTNFLRCVFSSGVLFLLAIVITSVILLLFYTLLEVYTKFGMEGGADEKLDKAEAARRK